MGGTDSTTTDTIYKIIEDIEKRKHIKDPFQVKYLDVVLQPMEISISNIPESDEEEEQSKRVEEAQMLLAQNLHNETGASKEDEQVELNCVVKMKDTIFQISQHVRTRCELLNQMYKSLLKQIDTHNVKPGNQRRYKCKISKEEDNRRDGETENQDLNLLIAQDYTKFYELYYSLNQSSGNDYPLLFDHNNLPIQFQSCLEEECSTSSVIQGSNILKRVVPSRGHLSSTFPYKHMRDGISNLELCRRTYTLLVDASDVTMIEGHDIQENEDLVDLDSITLNPIESQELLDEYILLERFEIGESDPDRLNTSGEEEVDTQNYSPSNSTENWISELILPVFESDHLTDDSHDNSNNNNISSLAIEELEKFTFHIIPIVQSTKAIKNKTTWKDDQEFQSDRKMASILFDMNCTPEVQLTNVPRGALRLKNSKEENLLEKRKNHSGTLPVSLDFKFVQELMVKRFDNKQDYQCLLSESLTGLNRSVPLTNTKTVYETSHDSNEYDDERNFLFYGMDIESSILQVEQEPVTATVTTTTLETLEDLSQMATEKTKVVHMEKSRLDFALKLFSHLTKKNTFRNRVPITRISSLMFKELQNNSKTRLSDVTNAILVKHLNMEDNNPINDDDISPQRMFMALIHLAHHVSTQRSSQGQSMTLEREESSNDILVTYEQEAL